MKKKDRLENKRRKRVEYQEKRRKKRARGRAHRWTLLVCAQNAMDSVRTVLCSHYVGEFDAQVHNKELSYEEVRALYNKGP